MRVQLFLMLSAMMAGAASASSFDVVPAPKRETSASMVVVSPPVTASFETASDSFPPQGIDPTVTLSYPFVQGEPPRDLAIVAPPAVLRQISPSLMAMEIRPQDRAAAAADAAHGPFSQPVVIRGGIVGDTLAAPEPQTDEPQVASEAEQPKPASQAEAPSRPEPVPPPSPSPAGPTRAPE